MDIHRIQVPAPMEIGDVNCYLILGDEVTLVDPGPSDSESFTVLEERLEKHGISMEDVDNILVTHPHSDHFGNASRIREISGAQTYAHADAVELLEDFQGYGRKLREFFGPYLEKRGVPGDEIDTVLEEGIPNQFGTSLEVDHPLEGGETIIEGISVIETPGHARGSISFLIGDELVAGDTVIEDITPNPTLQLPDNGEVPSSLALYLETLERLSSLDVSVVYGGHGGPVEELEDWIEDTRKHHAERKSRVLELVEERDRNAFQVMRSMFEGIEPRSYFLGMSEAIAHAKLLEKEEMIEERTGDGEIYYSAR